VQTLPGKWRVHDKQFTKGLIAMRHVLILFCAMSCFVCSTFAQNNTTHTLEIDGVPQEIKLGTLSKIKLKDGREIEVLLKVKDFSVFSAEGASFEHPSFMSVNSSPEDDGMIQHMAVSALGSMMLVQTHDDIDLQELLDTVYAKMVEEPVAMGIAVTKTDVNRVLKNNTSLKGYRATYKTAEDDVTVDMLIHKGTSKSYLLMTMHDVATAPDEKPAIDRFWSSLTLK
jgi:hypothetical protein